MTTSLYDIDLAHVAAASDHELEVLHRRAVKIRVHDLQHVANDHRLGKIMEVLIRTHEWIAGELGRRSLPHSDCPLVQKIRTSFGEFSRPLEIKNFPAVRLSEDDAKRLVDGDVSFLSVPWTPEAASILEKLGDGRITILSAGPSRGVQSAIGTAQIQGNFGESRNAPSLTAVALGSASEFRSAPIRFFPLVGPVRINAPAGGVLGAGVIKPEQTALEKREIETADITPALLGVLTDKQVADLAERLRERARESDVEPEAPVNAFVLLLAEADERKLDIRTDDRLDQVAGKLTRNLERTEDARKQAGFSGAHPHPHDSDSGNHDSAGLPPDGQHAHSGDVSHETSLKNLKLALGGHQHRSGDPIEGAHVGLAGDGLHDHPVAFGRPPKLSMAVMAEAHMRRPWLPGFVRSRI